MSFDRKLSVILCPNTTYNYPIVLREQFILTHKSVAVVAWPDSHPYFSRFPNVKMVSDSFDVLLEKVGNEEIDLVILDNVFHDNKAELFDKVVRMARSDIAVVMQAAVPIRRILDIADVIYTPYVLNPRNQPVPPSCLSKLSVYGADAIELKDDKTDL